MGILFLITLPKKYIEHKHNIICEKSVKKCIADDHLTLSCIKEKAKGVIKKLILDGGFPFAN